MNIIKLLVQKQPSQHVVCRRTDGRTLRCNCCWVDSPNERSSQQRMEMTSQNSQAIFIGAHTNYGVHDAALLVI